MKPRSRLQQLALQRQLLVTECAVQRLRWQLDRKLLAERVSSTTRLALGALRLWRWWRGRHKTTSSP